MAKLVDAVDSKSTGATHAGSSPALGTKVLYRYNALEIDPTQSQKGQVLKMFWIVLILFVISSLVLTAIILLQEAKQGGLGEGLGSGGDFSTSGGTAGGLHRMTIYLGVIWGVLALLLQLVPR